MKNKNKAYSQSESCSVVSSSLQPHGLYSPWKSPGQNTGVGSLSLSPGVLPNPGIESRSPALREDSLSAEPQGKPKNTGVGSLSLLQLIFPTQELNRGLQHCRPILYQLNYEGSLNAGDLGLIPGLGRSPEERERLPTPVFWPREFHRLYSPWVCKESDTTE